ncbi:ORF1224 [White spot syndrome virus]|uniref:ORF1224 n=1 Tax=White spot syndrome virus TaxID=342409 RepID=A0A2D3I6J9_9VIRU|nr:ORF1224 [White spot syndrome virus]
MQELCLRLWWKNRLLCCYILLQTLKRRRLLCSYLVAVVGIEVVESALDLTRKKSRLLLRSRRLRQRLL